MTSKQTLLDSLRNDSSNSQQDSKYLNTSYSAPYLNNNNDDDDNNNNNNSNNNIILKRKQQSTDNSDVNNNDNDDQDYSDRPFKKQASTFNTTTTTTSSTTPPPIKRIPSKIGTTSSSNNNNNEDDFEFSFGDDDMEQQRNMLLDEELEDQPLKYIWQWKTDNNKWVDYDISFCKRLEKHYKNGAVKDDFRVDNERYIDLKYDLQRRYDDRQKLRNVRRIPYSQSSSSSSSSSNKQQTSNNTKTNNNSKNNYSSSSTSSSTSSSSSTPNLSNRNYDPSKSNSSSSSSTSSLPSKSSSLKTNPYETYDKSIQGVWCWLSPNGWEVYNDETSTRLEKAFIMDKKRSEVDEDRYVEFEGKVQRRYDDPQKIRSIKRIDKDDIANMSSTSPITTVQPKTTTTSSSSSSSSGSSISSYFDSKDNKNQSSSSGYKSNNNTNQQTSSSPIKKTPSFSQSSSSQYSDNKYNNNNNNNNKPVGGSGGGGRWQWLSDNGYSDYEASVSEIIESAFLNKESTVEVAVGPSRVKMIIDLQSYVQRRADRPDLRRTIKRLVQASFNTSSSQPIKPIKPAVPKKIVKEPVFIDFNDDDGDYEDQMNQKPKQQYSNGDDIDFNDPDFREKKRALYACGTSYISEENILTWYEFIEEKRDKFKVPKNVQYPPNASLNKKISFFGGDITTLEIDGILNAAKPSLLGGGGIDGAIHKAAGYNLYRECQTLGGCRVGQSKITKAFRLPSKYIIHTVGPTNGDHDTLRSCYQTTLDIILKHNIRTFAFCCVATGIYGFPNKDAAMIALDTVRNWLEINHSKVDRLIFCVFTNEDYVIYGKLLQLYFPVHPSNE